VMPKMDAFLPPVLGLCKLCGMKFGGSVVTHGVSYTADEATKAGFAALATAHAKRLKALINSEI